MAAHGQIAEEDVTSSGRWVREEVGPALIEKETLVHRYEDAVRRMCEETVESLPSFNSHMPGRTITATRLADLESRLERVETTLEALCSTLVEKSGRRKRPASA